MEGGENDKTIPGRPARPWGREGEIREEGKKGGKVKTLKEITQEAMRNKAGKERKTGKKGMHCKPQEDRQRRGGGKREHVPARPARCTYCSKEDGTSRFTTCVSPGMSIPRAAISVVTQTRSFPLVSRPIGGEGGRKERKEGGREREI